MSARTAIVLAALAFVALPANGAAPPTVDTCRLADKAVVARALGAPVRDGRRLSGNGACQFHAVNRPVTATIAERAGDAGYFDAYLKNAHDELAIQAHPAAGIGERAARWPGSVAVLAHRRFALVTIIGLQRAQADGAALAIARDVAKRL